MSFPCLPSYIHSSYVSILAWQYLELGTHSAAVNILGGNIAFVRGLIGGITRYCICACIEDDRLLLEVEGAASGKIGGDGVGICVCSIVEGGTGKLAGGCPTGGNKGS